MQFLWLLALALIILKVTGNIAASWLVVFTPIGMIFALYTLLIILTIWVKDD